MPAGHSVTACRRCSGPLWPDEPGEWRCVQCGSRAYATPPDPHRPYVSPTPRKQPDGELGAQILALREEGNTYAQIVEQLGVTRGTISYYVQHRLWGEQGKAGNQRTENPSGRYHRLPADDRDRILALREQGLTAAKIAKRVTGIGYERVKNFLYKYEHKGKEEASNE